MKKERKISPSKIRYDQTHPLICFRTTTKEKNKIEMMAETTGKTISQIVTELLLKGYIDIENTYNNIYDSGFEDGEQFGRNESKKEFGIKIPCNECGIGDLFLLPNSDWHNHVIKLLKSYNWRHVVCYEKKKSLQSKGS